MSIIISEPGLYDDIKASDYHADPCKIPSCSRSLAKTMVDECPQAAWWNHPRLNPRFKRVEKTIFDLGTVSHALLAGQHDTYHVINADNYTSGAARAERDRAREAGLTPILKDQFASANDMLTAAQTYINGIGGRRPFSDENGHHELCAIAEDDGTWYRILMDYFDGETIWDYKTTSVSVNPSNLNFHAERMGWAFQAAFYMRVLKIARYRLANPTDIKFRFLVQQNEPPYLCSIVAPSVSALALADAKVSEAMQFWSMCMTTGQWPGYDWDTHFFNGNAKRPRGRPPLPEAERERRREMRKKKRRQLNDEPSDGQNGAHILE